MLESQPMTEAELCKRIGLRIREIRREKGLTITELAGRARQTPLEIAAIEHGRRTDSYLDTFDSIASGLGVALLDLFVFPERSAREEYIERMRHMSKEELRELSAYLQALPTPPAALRNARTSDFARKSTRQLRRILSPLIAR